MARGLSAEENPKHIQFAGRGAQVGFDKMNILILKIICGLATYYTVGDPSTKSHGVMANGQTYNKKSIHMAHRTIKLGMCGTLTNTRNNRMVSSVCVADRGPWGAIKKSEVHLHARNKRRGKRIFWRGEYWQWQQQRHLKQEWQYRGEFDLSEEAFKLLHARAFDEMCFEYKEKKNENNEK